MPPLTRTQSKKNNTQDEKKHSKAPFQKTVNSSGKLGPKRKVVLNGFLNQILEVSKLGKTPKAHLVPIWPNLIKI